MTDLITEYINLFDGIKQKKLIQMRKIIEKYAPEAIEKISYKMPAFYQKGILVYFAAQNKHLGFYPTGDAIKHFEKRLENLHYSKGAIQFPYLNELPEELIKDIVEYRIQQNLNK